jgi:PKD repeat protein
LGNATLATTSVVFNKPGTYVLRLSASNAFGETSSDLTITVAANPTAVFADWQESNWPGVTDLAIIGPTADPDSDGIANLLEFALQTTPKEGNALDTRFEVVGANIEFTYTRSRAASGVSYLLEWSDSLAAGTWSTVGVVQTDISADSNSPQQTIKATVPAGTGTKRFVRLRVTQP